MRLNTILHANRLAPAALEATTEICQGQEKKGEIVATVQLSARLHSCFKLLASEFSTGLEIIDLLNIFSPFISLTVELVE